MKCFRLVATNKEGVVENIFEDKRYFTSYKYAKEKRAQMERYLEHAISIEEVGVITDTERLEFMNKEQRWVYEEPRSSMFSIVEGTIWNRKEFKTPREAIDAAMKESK